MKPDLMSPKERIKSLLNGQPIDHIPFYPFILGFCARNVGYHIADMYQDAEKSYYSQLWTQQQFGFDWGPTYGYASYGTWEFGGLVKMPQGSKEQAPSHEKCPVTTEDDVYALALPDVKTAGCLPIAMEFSKFQELNGTQITLTMGGAFTIAGNICPVETLCRWMLKRPKLVHHLLQLAADHTIDAINYWAETFGGENVILQLWEPLSTSDIISPRHFREFVFPYLELVSQKTLQTGVKHIFYHICGEQSLNLPYWAELSMGDPGICSVGSQVEIEEAIRILGDKAIIAGNVEPSLIYTASPQEIFELSRKAIQAGKNAPRGFMLMSGCETPPDAPPHNVYRMRLAIDDFGWFS